tara:strand:+ start:29 stop:916 length:888 start_codon:yes stop_codon:yes gene_type:complete
MRCPICKAKNIKNRDPKTGKKRVQKFGHYYRTSDSKRIQRYKCLLCNNTFSPMTTDPARYQKKRRLNHKILLMLTSLNSQRRIAKQLNCNLKTVARKLIYLGKKALLAHEQALIHQHYEADVIQFDELQTIEHTKCKPLAVAVAVTEKTRKIVAITVSSMPATGYLSRIAKQKYGYRPDDRVTGLMQLFEIMKPVVTQKTRFLSDQHPYYKSILRAYYPNAPYKQIKGSKSCVAGQGELKKRGKDPLFYINHTLAMCRANINRLIRKTWCTTKDPAQLVYHLAIYMYVHNIYLTP